MLNILAKKHPNEFLYYSTKGKFEALLIRFKMVNLFMETELAGEKMKWRKMYASGVNKSKTVTLNKTIRK